MMKVLVASLGLLWLLMASSASSQSDNASVVDTNGRPLERGQEYYIKPAITDVGGRVTLINRNGSCPLYVGQENNDEAEGLPVIFTPFSGEDDVVKVNRDFKVAFSAATICAQSLEWKLGEKENGRRLISTGNDGRSSNYFRIGETQTGGVYNIMWCPTDVCPICKFDCGTAGGLRENGKILLALDGNVLPVVFERA